MLNPFYRPEWVESPLPAALPAPNRLLLQEAKAQASQAHLAMEAMLSGDQAKLLTEAVIAK
jgi:hypothetical protein